ncbi:MAG: ATP-binding cassette domain-containing protein [Puniceicoccales bacterium]|jgi:putative ABC transport system ATP-binding protein|nr:ATP-binding cassette domain-containing protein [Puniceicoccales bacterium]
MSSPSPERVPAISIHGLSHWFEEGTEQRQVLHDITVDIFPGEIVLVMGPSGSGKSTLLKLIGAQRAVQSGQILVNGYKLNGADKRTLVKIRRGIGFVFQSHHLLKSLTARQNVQIALTHTPGRTNAAAKTEALKTLQKVGMLEYAEKHPPRLSGGQNQRIAIARALVGNPRIILADEPTASLDKDTGREVAELLRALARNTQVSIVLVTHDNRIRNIADRVLLLEDGHLRLGDNKFATGEVEAQ